MAELSDSERVVKTSEDSVSVFVCGDREKPALITVDDLADHVVEVLDFSGLKEYEERVLGLIFVSPVCKAHSWTEWFYNKVLLNLLKEFLLQRYFSKEIRCSMHGSKSDLVQTCRKLLDERYSLNVMRFLEAMNRRHDLTDNLKNLHCKTLIFVGESSPFHAESMYMSAKMDRKVCALFVNAVLARCRWPFEIEFVLAIGRDRSVLHHRRWLDSSSTAVSIGDGSAKEKLQAKKISLKK
ncbi:hypothetical protein ACJRO7_011255 [Eucalyptus globulus]|uniref:Uncharacterized protein n=1 Tax=Eucalyptus globulus TaxID=34317 RepID=A0ABD3LES5_EUCGL